MAKRLVRGEKLPVLDKNLIFVGDTSLKQQNTAISGTYVEIAGEKFYKIGHYDQMEPFFMSIVSGGDHWLFISSTGGMTAGRVNPDSALFPYETEDKLTMHGETSGSKTILWVARDGQWRLWEPFSERYAGVYQLERHLYKNMYGSKLIFEEVNVELGLSIRQMWRTGEQLGFVKSSHLINKGQACSVAVLDGLVNLLPYGATAATQNSTSNLLNAYKRNELDESTGIGLFTMSATLTDRAEPSESLKTTVAWQVGLEDVTHLLSARQLEAFRAGQPVTQEVDILGKAGAYIVGSTFELEDGEKRQWHIVADVNQDAADVVALKRFVQQDAKTVIAELEKDIDKNTAVLVNYVAAADGLQMTAAEGTVVHHFANVMFNVMRGGIFADGYKVEKRDLIDFVKVRNRPVLARYSEWFAALPPTFEIDELYKRATNTGATDLIRLAYEYLPLTFSRRHGDPSRPWNHFSINLKHEDGSTRLDYQGNWRDIFQNWEPLALSFPTYVTGMIAKFLNATTADGYNPYRVTRDGIEWEVPEPENPWSNIGYWSDHQIIYLQKLLEVAAQVRPDEVVRLWNEPLFTYANVPYRIRPYEEILADWYDTIVFDEKLETEIGERVKQIGTDGKLMLDKAGKVLHVTMVEKLLVLLLAKLANLVPEGGIWMNTQRPEWNDANNALVGKGLSVVTAAYLRRFIKFWQSQLVQHLTESEDSLQTFTVNSAVADLFEAVQTVFTRYQPHLESNFSAESRRAIMDELGTAVTTYRTLIYENGMPDEQVQIGADNLKSFLALAQRFIDHTLHANHRSDGLGHTYNILNLEEDGVYIENLYLMLEGQVGYLSSGLLSSEEALTLLHSLRQSDLYRADQHSYMLYPNRKLPGFFQKNNVTAEQVADSELVAALTAANDPRLLVQDDVGDFHFNGRFRNANDAAAVLHELAEEPAYAELVTNEREFILDLFERTFDHNSFTGRSGTFFAYEGLGSIYWHMVSKLLLAAQECYQQAVAEEADPAVIEGLAEAYYDIRSGIGFNKEPDVYGAFPTDPYSHTPMNGGASQPGMTGLVKEEILTRWGELGVKLQQGLLCFEPTLLRTDEFLEADTNFAYVDINGDMKTLSLTADSLAFTFCQVPIIYQRGADAQIEVVHENTRSTVFQSQCLDMETTQHILNRDGQIRQLRVTIAN